MKVLIRADASTKIGTGHVMRCLTLAGDLRKLGMEVSFICYILPGSLCDYIESKGFKVYRLDPIEELDDDYWAWLGENWLDDAKKTQEIILNQAGDQADINNVETETIRSPKEALSDGSLINISSHITAQVFLGFEPSLELGSNINLVVDSYALDRKWEKFLRPSTNKIMAIDDLANRVHDCDLLLDQNYFRDMEHRYDGLVSPTCQMLLGPKYALLRSEFHRAKKELRKRDGKVQRILVFFGGSDPTNETKKALEAIRLLNRPEVAVDVVVGASNPHKKEIKKRCSQMPNTTYYCQVENMAELMVKADLAIGAGGATTWERLYLELPTIAIAVAENQVETLEALEEKDVVRYLGWHREISVIGLARTVNTLLFNP
ncbi:MAG TPA: UDP-2,4-diacetamido-2,4,6-trideoxy-beta-L-altropyranose hydrolase [Firmicutes bacterium]|jgi:UDP-2,4-diacetamido-2,4,6-trideoxy-beta-L-altropyranose hydrolase|nr:UDP-2,4-diacetamido-2,4,6-trideoxy-beta-L-altropyranose hydrolase [Bacillota bacterium]